MITAPIGWPHDHGLPFRQRQVSQQQFKEKTKLDLLKKGHYFEGKERIIHVVLHPNPFKLGGNFFTAPNLSKGFVKFVGQLLCMKDIT